MRLLYIIFVQILLISVCLCKLSDNAKDRLLNGFVDYINNVPHQPYTYEEGVLISAQNTAVATYWIETRIKVSELHNIDVVKLLKCTGTVVDHGDNGITVHDDYRCIELPDDPNDFSSDLEELATDGPISTEGPEEWRPVQLDNEVQPNNALTSGEQFVAIPRESSAPCIGCSTHVSLEAAGVTELAELGVRHLDRHEPNVRHTLNTVLDVERQVQVVNGVRYIVTLTVNYNNCTDTVTEDCACTKPCKISILEKPWLKLHDGSKYRAIVANNCTEEWLFDDNGEVIPPNSHNNNESNEINVDPFNNNPEKTEDQPKPTPDYDKIANTGSVDDILKVIHSTDLQAQQKQEKIFTDEEIRNIHEQIIPHDHFRPPSNINEQTIKEEQTTEINAEHIETLETAKRVTDNSEAVKESDENAKAVPLTEDKKKVIDDMMNFFKFAGFETKTDEVEENVRMRRSYDNDLKVMALAEKYQILKKNVHNAKYIYALGQTMVDYLNEMDMEVKTRTLKDMIAAEEEFENHQHFFYLQARVAIPCDKAECNNKDDENKICNGVIDNSNPNSPQVLTTFCYNEEKKPAKIGAVKTVSLKDPILQELIKESVKKIESESSYLYANRVVKILSANTQRVSGVLTKISLVLEYLDCNKSVPLGLRLNCTSLQRLGSKICEIEIHERKWLNEKKVTYTCTDRPIGESFMSTKPLSGAIGINTDPKVIEIAQEALQYLEVQSNRNNKQKIVEIKSVSTQIVAGLLTNVEFVVGYTECVDDFGKDINTCKLLEKEQLRQCHAQVWERPWLQDGRQVNVTCDDALHNEGSNDISKYRKKRSPNLDFVGGQTQQNTDNSEYQALAEESLQKYLQSSASTVHHKVIKIQNVTTQVVAGSLTRIDFLISPTNCQLDENRQPTAPTCEVQNSADVISCHSRIWERSWLKSKEINVSCSDVSLNSRTRRQTLGGEKEEDLSDPKYQVLAEESLQQYLQTSGETQHHKVVHMVQVKSQVVSGFTTKIDFKVSPTNCQLDSNGKPTSSNCEVQSNADVFSCHSEVWEQSWLNKKEITVNCTLGDSKSREKRQVPGGETDQDPNDAKYRALAVESLQQYLRTSGASQHHDVVTIEKVKTQVVSGSLTKIDFKVSPTNCQLDSNGKPTSSNCEVPSNADVFSCHSDVWEQSWLKKKEITVNCNLSDAKSRETRQVKGGQKEQDPNDPTYRALAEESLQQYLQTSGTSEHHRVVNVQKVTTQVVSGSMTRIDFTVSPTNCQVDSTGQPSSSNCEVPNTADVFSCHSEIWEQPWLNKKEITVNCTLGDGKSREKRQVPGGDTDQDPNDAKYRALAVESLQQYLRTSGASQHHDVVTIEKVKTQVVSGSLTKIDFKVSPTNCQLDSNGKPTSSNCEVPSNADVFSCHSDVWEQSWLKKKEITVNCNLSDAKSRETRHVKGGQKEQDPNEPTYRALAEESLQQYLQTSGTSEHHRVVNLQKVTTQVVSGSMTRIDFTVSPTNCQVDSTGQPSSSNCEVPNTADVFSCHSEIWEQPWLNKKEITVNCTLGDGKSREKRQVPGGDTDQDPNDAKYRALAVESLQQYLRTSGASQHHDVVTIEKVKTQVVSGSLTKIDFKVSPTNCQLDSNGKPTSSNCEVPSNADVFSCHSDVWEQSWLNKKEITVNCTLGDSKSREKRQVPGGETDQDPNDAKYRPLAVESMQQYLRTSGASQHHDVVTIEKVKTQVVSGSLTKIDFKVSPTNCQLDSNGKPTSSNCEVPSNADVFSCHSDVWEQSWLKKKEITVNCNLSDAKSRETRQVKGGQKEQDRNDPTYRALAEESLQQYLQTSGTSEHHRVVNVQKVTTQVVSGSMTRIDFTVSPTNCQVDSTGQPSSSNCEVPNTADVFSCHSEIWEQPWLNKKEITVNCTLGDGKSREKRQVPGGDTDQDPNDAKYRALAVESLQQYLRTSGASQHHDVVTIEKVKTQVVSGSLTKIDFKVSPTNCQLDSNGKPTSSNCEVPSNADVFSCHSDVWEQSWLKKKEITVNCNLSDAKSRETRHVKGGQKEQDPNEPTYRALAEESLQQYLQTSGTSEHHRVVNLQKVTTQVVSGSMTRIDFTVSPTNCQVDSTGQPSSSNCEVPNTADVFSCHSEIWEQPWLNKKEITVNCTLGDGKSREKRQVPGGDTDQDPNDAKYRALAVESLQQYLRTSGASQHHDVVTIENVKTQVVSGSLTKIDFKVSPTNCQLDSNGKPTSSNCEVPSNADVFSCHSDVWEQSWLNKKEITVNCTLGDSKSREKRQVPGGETDQDPNDAKYRALAVESLQQYLRTSGASQHHDVVTIEKVKTQVVSGSLTKIDFKVSPTNCQLDSNGKPTSSNCEVPSNADVFSCHSDVWEQSWLKKKEITVNCNLSDAKSRETSQVKGGQKEQDPNDPTYRALAEESLQQYLQTSGTSEHHRVVNVQKVTTQVVSGSMTRIDFTVSPTNCQVDSTGQPSSSNCEVPNTADVFSCHSEIWEQPWLNKKEITVNCTLGDGKSREKRQVPGGDTDQDPNDAKYRALAVESLQQYLRTSGASQHHDVVTIEKVKTQVVSGSLTKIDFKVSPTNCQLDSNGKPTSSNCEVPSNADVFSCHSDVWEQSWLKKKEITVNCNLSDAKSRETRHVKGGQKEQDPNEPTYRALAEESLQQYLQTSGTSEHHRVVNLQKVTTQVVSGSMTRIDFTVSPTNCQIDSTGQPSSSNCVVPNTADVFSCHSEIWEQPWLNKKEITVNCTLGDGKSREKRHVPGGDTDQDPNDAKYRALAVESLQQYLRTSGASQHYDVVTIEKVKTQVVSGSLTKIDFKVSPTNCQLDSNGKPTSSNCEVPSNADVFSCHSDVWEQSWLKKKEITVNCTLGDSKSSEKREVPGGETDQDPNDAKYRALAVESLQQYLRTSGASQHHDVVTIEKVKTQVVSGYLTKIDFKVSPTNCQLDSICKLTSPNCEVPSNADVFSCHSDVWEQSWLKKKEITVNCNLSNAKSRETSQVTGGQKEQDPNDPTYRALAEESLQQYLQTSGTSEHHRVVNLQKVTTQVVSGSMTRIDFTVSPTNCRVDSTGQPSFSNCVVPNTADVFSCHSEIWEQPWLNKKEITVNCTLGDGKSREKQQVPGGETDQDPNDAQYRVLAVESLQQYLRTSGASQHYDVVTIEKVKTQVVTGFLTKIDFKVSPTNCQLDSDGKPTSSNCEVQSNADVFSCHSDVWERPWLNKIEFTVNCTLGYGKSREKQQVPGGETDQDPNDAKYWALAVESLQQYLRTSGASQHHDVVTIEKVKTQVVSGSLTKIDFKVSPTNCQLDSNGKPTSSNCEVPSNADVFSCHSDVWEQSWLKKKKITVNCNLSDAKSRETSQVKGGQKEQDPNDPTYRALAEESLQQYLQTSGTSEHHRVVNLQKVTTQVVSGSMTRIDFTVSPTNCRVDSTGQPSFSNCVVPNTADVFSCHSEIWEQPWLNKKEITVNCTLGDGKSREKQQVPGGETDQDPNDAKYWALAVESLQQYLRTSGASQHHDVVTIEKVKTQVVSGSLTKIDFKVSPTNCQLDSNGKPTSSNCEVPSNADVFSCHSDVWEQSWLKKKEITVNCTLDGASIRTKRSAVLGKVIEHDDANNEPFKALAEESLHKYLLSTQSKRVHKVIEIERVKTQVVSGKKTIIDFKISPTNCETDDILKNELSSCDIDLSTIIRCHSEVWERPWLKDGEGKVIDVECEDAALGPAYGLEGELSTTDMDSQDIKLLPDENFRNTRSLYSGRGGPREQDATKPEFRALAKESLRKYMRLIKSNIHHEVVEVNRVVKKVVAGVIYNIDYKASPTSCFITAMDKSNCVRNSAILYCHAKIWDRPWLKRKEINVRCSSDVSGENDENEIDNDSDSREKRGLGTHNRKDVDSDHTVQLAEQALEKFQRRSNSQYAYKITKIHHIDEQVVAGIVTTIHFSISMTKCLATEERAVINDCELDDSKVLLNCHATIQDLPIPMSKSDIRMNCKKKNANSSRQKRDSVVSVANREKRQNAIDDDYIDEDAKYYYADRAMSDYNKNQLTNNLFKLITIHDVQRSMHMKTLMVRLYLEIAMTYCMRHGEEHELHNCDEIEGLNHRLCLARVWPSPDDEMIVQQVSMVCDDDEKFKSISGISVPELIKASIEEIEKSPDIHYKLFHEGEANVVPSLDYKIPIRISFIASSTNCTKDIDLEKNIRRCFPDERQTAKVCTSYVYMLPNTRNIHHIEASCRKTQESRKRRSISSDPANATADDLIIQKLVQDSLEKLEMASTHRYKQRLLLINSYSSKITTGKQTTIDFDVGYTNCLKYEWVENITSCEFIEHLPRRHCVSQIFERLWIENGKNIEVNCEDDETPLEAHIEFESAENAMQLAKEALKHIEAKYPNPFKQKVVRIFSLEKQAIAGVHYRMKLEVGFTNCMALSIEDDCKLTNSLGLNKFCRVNVWLRPWTEHPPSFRVSCDYQDGATAEVYHQIQSENLFYHFLTTYKPDYMNDHTKLKSRFEIFRANVRKIHELNIYERGTARYAVTRFSDLSEEEFKARYLGLKPSLRGENQVPMRKADIPKVELPEKFDWREFDAVTEVKNQGSCGSCWAFSVTGNIEGQWKMKSGKLVSLSEQELVDCDKLDNGCNGGLPDNAYRAIEQMGGLETETDYPYEGENDKCSFNKTLSRVQISGAVNISSNETDMAKWLVKHGPISIGINANAMQFYVGGVSHPWKILCNASNLDHGVLIVGYGVKDYPLFHKRLPYWIVKNSWGESWGEQGYYRVYRGDGTCGVNQMASSAVI